MVYDIKLARK